MLRWGFLVLLVLGAAAATLSQGRPSDRIQLDHRIVSPASTPVQVQHQIVTAETTGTADMVPARVAAKPSRSPIALSSSRHDARTAAQPGRLMHRAARAFLGDGRHRPQPFPRVREN